MNRNYLLLCLFSFTVWFLAATVAREAIIGGTRALHISIFPYQVSIQVFGHGHVCGGGIVGNYHVLTAAHCVLNDTGHLRSAPITVVARTVDLNETGPPVVTIRVDRVFSPMEFHLDREFSYGDIALLMLADSLQLEHNENLKKLEFPRYNTHVSRATITGFGWNELNSGTGHTDGRLRYAVVDIYRDDKCVRSYPPGMVMPEKHICAEIRPPPFSDLTVYGVCHGDSGSPLVRNGTIIGILSRIQHHCNDRQEPEVYTRLVRYRRMITNVMTRGRNPRMVEVRN